MKTVKHFEARNSETAELIAATIYDRGPGEWSASGCRFVAYEDADTNMDCPLGQANDVDALENSLT